MLGNVGSKIISFFLVRLYTDVFSPAEYGQIDLGVTTATLIMPLLTLAINEAILRYSMDSSADKTTVLYEGIRVCTISNIITIILAASAFAIWNSMYIVYTGLLVITNTYYSIYSSFMRGIGKTKTYAFSGVLHSVIQIVAILITLLVFKCGVSGYFLSFCLANTLTTVYLMICSGKYCTINRRNANITLRKEMIGYSLPLVFSTVSWWIMNSADRYVISYFMNSDANGLYAVASKIPTLVNVVCSVFFQAWQLSSVQQHDADDKSDFFSNVYRAILAGISICASILLSFDKYIYAVLVNESYSEAWMFSGFLVIAMVFSCLASFYGTNYIAEKDTKAALYTSIFAALINITLNIVLTPRFGLNGTAAATAIAYLCVFIVRAVDTKKYVKMKNVSSRTICIFLCLAIQSISVSCGCSNFLLHLPLLTIIVLVNIRELINVFRLIKGESVDGGENREK